MANINPATTTTLEDFIEMRSIDEMTYYNFSILEVINGVEHLNHNLIEDYLEELKSACITVDLTLDQYKKYKYIRIYAIKYIRMYSLFVGSNLHHSPSSVSDACSVSVVSASFLTVSAYFHVI